MCVTWLEQVLWVQLAGEIILHVTQKPSRRSETWRERKANGRFVRRPRTTGEMLGIGMAHPLVHSNHSM
jgi:hypothetical protein